MAFFTIIILIRLFQLQVLEHGYYQEIATREQYGYIELPAQRGEIIIKDYHSGEEFLIATNTTLNLLFADPLQIGPHRHTFHDDHLGLLAAGTIQNTDLFANIRRADANDRFFAAVGQDHPRFGTGCFGEGSEAAGA